MKLDGKRFTKVAGPPRDAGGNGIGVHPRPLFRGNGDTDYPCSHCRSVMALHMAPGERVIVDNATCSARGAVNKFPADLRP